MYGTKKIQEEEGEKEEKLREGKSKKRSAIKEELGGRPKLLRVKQDVRRQQKKKKKRRLGFRIASSESWVILPGGRSPASSPRANHRPPETVTPQREGPKRENKNKRQTGSPGAGRDRGPLVSANPPAPTATTLCWVWLKGPAAPPPRSPELLHLAVACAPLALMSCK